jgi:hypothetical protein
MGVNNVSVIIKIIYGCSGTSNLDMLLYERSSKKGVLKWLRRMKRVIGLMREEMLFLLNT